MFLFGKLKKGGDLHRLETEADDEGKPQWQEEDVARRPDQQRDEGDLDRHGQKERAGKGRERQVREREWQKDRETGK